MFGLIFTFVALIGVILSFWYPVEAWILIGIAEAVIIIVLFGQKTRKWKHVPELSQDANEMLQKFGHFYAMPFAGREFSSSASAFQLSSIVIGIICGFKFLWWGVGIAVANMFLMAYVSRAFNPTQFLLDERERIAHEEVISYITSKE